MTDETIVQGEVELENVQNEVDLARVELEKLKNEIEDAKKKKKKVEARRDISEDEQRIIDKQVTNINQKKSTDDVIAKQKTIDNQKVKGRFMNRRNPGQAIKLPYHKYVDDPVVWYHFQDGGVYTIPRGFADQINVYYQTPIFVQ